MFFFLHGTHINWRYYSSRGGILGQHPYRIIVYTVTNYRPILVTFERDWNVIEAVPYIYSRENDDLVLFVNGTIMHYIRSKLLFHLSLHFFESLLARMFLPPISLNMQPVLVTLFKMPENSTLVYSQTSLRMRPPPALN